MIPLLGTTCIILLIPVSLYSLGMTWIGQKYRDAQLFRSGLHASYATCFLLTMAAALLIAGFVGDHFEILYVTNYSNRALPLFYKIAGLWAGLDGSLLLWVWILSILSIVALRQVKNKLANLLPMTNAVFMVTIAFFGVLLLFSTNPFEVSALIPLDGKGLNPLLQAPEMVIHPPNLYMGYVSAAIPFALVMAGLFTRDMSDRWLSLVRNWMIFCWFFLSTGNLLGMHWAYAELGWGGYWAWDPVENAAALPWFTATAFLHSIIVQQRRGMLKTWNVSLVVLTFLLTIFGTYLTRSGVVQSVHAFSNSTLGLYFGGFLCVAIVFSFGMIIARRHTLISKHRLRGLLSKEGVFLINNILLTVGCFSILIGTMFPTLAELFANKRMAVGPEFFNTMMAPFGLLLVVMAGFGPVIAWRKDSVKLLLKRVAWALIPGLLASIIAFGLGVRHWFAVGIVGAITYTLLITIGEFVKGARVVRARDGLSWLMTPLGLLRKSQSRYGGYVAHLAVLLIFVGFTGSIYQYEKSFSVKEGDKVSVRGYDIEFAGLRYRSNDNLEAIAAELQVRKNGKLVDTIFPARQFYKVSEQATTEVAIHRTWQHDLYTVLGTFNVDEDQATINIVHNPLISFIWIGGFLLVFATLIIVWPIKAKLMQSNIDEQRAENS